MDAVTALEFADACHVEAKEHLREEEQRTGHTCALQVRDIRKRA